MSLGVQIDLDAPDAMEQIRHNIELLWKEYERLSGLSGPVKFSSPVDFRVKKTIGGLTGLPALHKSSHQNDGTDELSVQGLSGLLADRQTPLLHKTAHQAGGEDELDVSGLSGELADPQLPKVHATDHEDGGADELDVSGLSGELADDQPPKAHDNTKHSTAYQATSEKNAANGYAGLSAASRTTKGVDTTDDVIVDLATKGTVYKSANGHYWRVTMSDAGAIVITDLGTTKP